jgi:exopolysaccharide production protein ExoY
MDGSSAFQRVSADEVSEYPEASEAAPRVRHPQALGKYSRTPVVHLQWRGKRLLDIFGAVGLGILALPVVVFVSAWLFLSGGPVLFRHMRVGRGGRQFVCYKFRTMVPNAEQVLDKLFECTPSLRAEWILHHKLRDDPRVTRIGYFLRRTSLDELPQLWNVLMGDMSLVGPRPIVHDEIFRYGRAIRHYLAVKPGLTGLWQVSGRNDIGYCRRVALDRAYAMRSSLRLDIWILLQTAKAITGQRGAY